MHRLQVVTEVFAQKVKCTSASVSDSKLRTNKQSRAILINNAYNSPYTNASIRDQSCKLCCHFPHFTWKQYGSKFRNVYV